jgi:hypothetical protein
MHIIRNTAKIIPKKCFLIFENFRIWPTEEGRFHLKAKAADQKKIIMLTAQNQFCAKADLKGAKRLRG